jgi:hypothetical protein
LSQKVRKHLSSDRISYPERKKISSTSLRKSRDMLITLVNKDFVPRGKIYVSDVFFLTMNSSMFPKFLYHPHLSLQVKGLESSKPGL